jgi:hypothetical protein
MMATRVKGAVAVLTGLAGLAYLFVVTEPRPERERASLDAILSPIVYEKETRAVNTDSLYRLYHTAFLAPHPDEYLQEIMCEDFRLVLKYGGIPTMQAMKRMKDTLWSPAEREGLFDFDRRLERNVEINERICGVGPNFPRAPIELDVYPDSVWHLRDTTVRHKP